MIAREVALESRLNEMESKGPSCLLTIITSKDLEEGDGYADDGPKRIS